VAPNASYSASDMSGLSVNTVDQLFEASSEVIVSTTVPFVVFLTLSQWNNFTDVLASTRSNDAVVCFFIPDFKSRGVNTFSSIS